MSDFKRKDRIISLRISHAEFQTLKTVYTGQGLRSMSEFARAAMQRVAVDGYLLGDSIESRVRALDTRVALMQTELARLSHIVENGLALSGKA